MYSVCHAARSREDETRNGYRNERWEAKVFFKTNSARAGWPRCLALGRATPRRLRVQKLTLLVFDDVKSPGQSFHE